MKLKFIRGLATEEPSADRALVRCIAGAVVLILATYPDVIFSGASLSIANIINPTIVPRPEKVDLFLEPPDAAPYQGYFDLGGAGFQSEPGAQFMKNALAKHQSIYWNPYSATGSFGVETLVDIKTSPVSLAVALFQGSDTVFDIAFLAFSLLGVFCILVLFHVQFRLPFIAAMAGGVTYLLNGYNVANLASNTAQTWLYFPVLGLALVAFARRPSLVSFLGIAVGTTLVAATTFLPTTMVVLGTTIFVGAASAVAFALAARPDRRHALLDAARLACGQFMGVAFGFVLLAVIYLPIYEALQYMHSADAYAVRHFFAAKLVDVVSFFTPKHVFESYNSLSPRAAAFVGNVSFHQGIIASLIAAQAVRKWPHGCPVIVAIVGTALIFVAARIYGMPGVSAFADALPIIQNIGEQYLWSAAAILFTMCVPFGAAALFTQGVRLVPLVGMALIVLGAFAYTAAVYGLEEPRAWMHGIITISIIALGGILFCAAKRYGTPTAIAIVALSWSELTYYGNHARLSRTERFSNPPDVVRYLQSRSDLHRVASFGSYGIPPEYGSAYGIYQIGSMNYQLFPRYVALFDRLILPDPADRWPGFITMVRARDSDALNLAALDLVGTKYLLAGYPYAKLASLMQRAGWDLAYKDPYFSVYENPRPLPRAFVVHSLTRDERTPVDLGQSPLRLATSDDAELLREAARHGITAAEAVDGEAAKIIRYEHAEIEIAADLPRPGVLILNDVWHPNWKAVVDGEAAYIGVADEAFRGIVLPAGRHIVQMTYAPQSLRAGQLLSVGAVLVVFLLLAFKRRVDGAFSSLFAGRGPLHGSATITR